MSKQRMYNVVRVRDDNGNEVQMNATPMTHDEACTFLSKLTKYKWCRDMLVEVVGPALTDAATARRVQSALDDGECPACHGSFYVEDVQCKGCGYTLDEPTQVPSQSVYTLELAVGDDVASKEYMDHTRAKQAYNDAVQNVTIPGDLYGCVGVTRIELFSEAVGSMDKWERS